MMQRTRVKICGLTRVQDVQAACALGADAVGFVCFAGSPRFVALDRLAQLAGALAPLVTPVLLFVDAPVASVEAALQRVPHALLQFHGSEDAAYCAAFGRPYLKAVAVREGSDLIEFENRYASALGLLVDTPAAAGGGVHGGSGQAFDWSRLPDVAQRRLPLVLAGGLQAGNVAAAVLQVRPTAVDVSSGVEEQDAGTGAVQRGIKSAARMGSFLAAVRAADVQMSVQAEHGKAA